LPAQPRKFHRSPTRHPGRKVQERPLRLRLSRPVSLRHRGLIIELLSGLPALTGSPIFVSSKRSLTAFRGRLLSGTPRRGTPVHAASFIRKRTIILELELLDDIPRFCLILVHELFHFVWPRLARAERTAFERLLIGEIKEGARGEVGESAAVKKRELLAEDLADATWAWRDYVCESFCDTAASLYGNPAEHDDFTLAKRWWKKRSGWFGQTFSGTRYC
jgi:hypothetical protein